MKRIIYPIPRSKSTFFSDNKDLTGDIRRITEPIFSPPEETNLESMREKHFFCDGFPHSGRPLSIQVIVSENIEKHSL